MKHPKWKGWGYVLAWKKKKEKMKDDINWTAAKVHTRCSSSSVKCHRSYHSQMSLHHQSRMLCLLQPQAAILQRKEGTFDAATNSAKIRPNQPLRRFNPKAFSKATTLVVVAVMLLLPSYLFSTSSNRRQLLSGARCKKGLWKLGEKRSTSVASAHKFCTIRYREEIPFLPHTFYPTAAP